MSDEKGILRIRELEIEVPDNQEPLDHETVAAVAKFRAGEKLSDDEIRRVSASMALNGGYQNKNCNGC